MFVILSVAKNLLAALGFKNRPTAQTRFFVPIKIIGTQNDDDFSSAKEILLQRVLLILCGAEPTVVIH